MRVVAEYSQFYRFGKGARAGGGNPIRDPDGNVTAEFGNFATQEQQWQSDPYDAVQQPRRSGFQGAAVDGTKGYSPTRAETLHMRPTNNFEDITEMEFDRRERAKAEYRQALQEQMAEATEAKETGKRQALLKDI